MDRAMDGLALGLSLEVTVFDEDADCRVLD